MLIEEPFSDRPLIAGRYRVDGSLGAGGSGFVMLATDQQLQTQVVLKFLHDYLVEDEAVFVRFRQETAVAYELAHPNIVQTYSFERAEGYGCFMTMEYVP